MTNVLHKMISDLNWYLDVTDYGHADEVTVEGQNLDFRMIWIEGFKHGYTTYLGGDIGIATYFHSANSEDYVTIYYKHRTHLYNANCIFCDTYAFKCNNGWWVEEIMLNSKTNDC